MRGGGEGLGDERVVMRRHGRAGYHMAVDPDARPAGRMPARQPARRRLTAEGVLGVDAAFDGMAAPDHVALAERQFLAHRNADLFAHDVEAGDLFGDRMLDLDARVHLDEGEDAVLVENLEGAGAAIADGPAGSRATLAKGCDLGGGKTGRRRLLDHLLMTALHGTVALAQPQRVAVVIAENLDLDMARMLQELLDVEIGIGESAHRLLARRGDGRAELRL